MKAYLLTTGVLFLALAVVHVLRVLQEQHLARDPWFIATTLIAITLAGWAYRLYTTARRSNIYP